MLAQVNKAVVFALRKHVHAFLDPKDRSGNTMRRKERQETNRRETEKQNTINAELVNENDRIASNKMLPKE